MKSLLYFLLLLTLVYGKGNSKGTNTIIETKSGNLVGKQINVPDGTVTGFLGIPFAEPPLGDLRFKKPKSIEKWDGVLEATSKPPPCMQYSSRNFSWIPTNKPDEDCLYLNIWAPGNCCQYKTKLPVMVWIYGGGYSFGSTDIEDYDGAVLAGYNNAIIVSMNYRVGIFGFLSAGTDEAPGNMGLHDQNLALKWIRDNIGYFGGDSKQVTLFGESAGSVSVGIHMVSPMSKGLFKRAIMESGAPFHPVATDDIKVALFKGNVVAQGIGCADETVNMFTKADQVVECLKKKEGMVIAQAESTITNKAPFFFLPIYGDEFLPKSPISALESGEFNDVEVLIGNNANEGSIFMNYFSPELFPKEKEPHINTEIASQLIYGMFMNVTNPKPEIVVSYYTQQTPLDDSKSLVQNTSDAFGDYIFVCPSLYFAEKLTNTYYYWLTYRSPKSRYGEWIGVGHTFDVPYVFGAPIRENKDYIAEDKKFSEEIMKIWYSFATTGVPSNRENNLQWEKFDGNNPRVLNLHPQSYEMRSYPRLEACKFWRPYIVPSVQE